MDSIEKKILSLTQDRVITKRIDLEESIYIYSKERKDDKFTGPPLYISKLTGEYKFLFSEGLINGHKDLRDYYFNCKKINE